MPIFYTYKSPEILQRPGKFITQNIFFEYKVDLNYVKILIFVQTRINYMYHNICT